MRNWYLLTIVIIFSFSLSVGLANAYSDREYKIYKEMMDAPMSEPEAKVYKRLGKKHGVSPSEVKATVERVMREVHSGGSTKNQSVENQVKTVIGKLTKVKKVTASGEFVTVAYVEQFTAHNDDNVQNRVINRMPKILAAAFSIEGVDRVRLIAYYPTLGGGESKVAGLEALRSELEPQKPANAYSGFWKK